MASLITGELDKLVKILARLPGLGPRSARRAALYLIKRRESLLAPLAEALNRAATSIHSCSNCGNLDEIDPCTICSDERRDHSVVCIVEDIADLWALERSGVYRGCYHVLGGTLSALDGVGPEDLNIDSLISRSSGHDIKEIILATNATVEGQTTAHYLIDLLEGNGSIVSQLAQGMPMGGELDYLDEGTLGWAIKSRKPVSNEL